MTVRRPVPTPLQPPYVGPMGVQRLENVGIVVKDLPTVMAFFVDLGLEVVGEQTVEGPWVDDAVGLDEVRSTIAVLQTPDGHGRLELMQYLHPESAGDTNGSPPNTLGLHRLSFEVDDLDAELARLREQGYEPLRDVGNYQDVFRLCYVRGPEGLIVMLFESLN